MRGVSFSVRKGEIFGLLGPNGAGKTTTIKCILRLVFPDEGQVLAFGQSVQDRDVAKRIGYMPENPYVYQYLKPLEFLDLCGRLLGMAADERRERSLALLKKVGLEHALDRPVGKFSKGMMQRVGLAQALLGDPDLLILDEPMSGLDPIGRKEIRDVLLEQRDAGKTMVFTSHILADVEALCDRIALMRGGLVRAEGPLHDLMRRGEDGYVAEFEGGEHVARALGHFGEVAHSGVSIQLSTRDVGRVTDAIAAGQAEGGRLVSVSPSQVSLESLFEEDEDEVRAKAERV